MILNKKMLILATLLPISLGLIILYNFISAINELRALGQSTALVYNQVIVIGITAFLGLTIYWCIMMYLIYLLQENMVAIDKNLERAAGIGSKHLTESKKLLNQVIDILKRFESK